MNIKVGHHTFCSASTTAFPRARIINRTTYIIPTILKNSNDGHKDRNCADQRCARASDSENTSSASGARSVGAGGSGGGKRGGGKSGKAGKNRGAAPAQGQSQQRDKEKGKSLKAPPGAQGHQKSDEARTSPSSPTEANTGAGAGTDGGDAVEAVCWICAEPVKYYSVSTCNHRTCHVCALRLRALYKKLDCAFCKVCVQLHLYRVRTDALGYRNRNKSSFLLLLQKSHTRSMV